MTDDELVVEYKKDAGMPLTISNLDNQIIGKIKTVKAYIINAGVSDTAIESDLATGTIILGINDLLNSSTFSTLFETMLTQLANS
ncbi:hypothetical protein [Clostridium felsineum]|uniref:Uncharacterized protein n=1 Tax=Clostridium felsineum TaxID=36839 RepID=A0A1S8MDW1_9CLOT|nr:hypothetical protein [Clostridium felsineum]URZ06485.1 hypothetical protein CLROS_018180 [Clostridium felsineum]URZ11520.1 hypothetical protein CROST_022370 [Clostridium felsineum]